MMEGYNGYAYSVGGRGGGISLFGVLFGILAIMLLAALIALIVLCIVKMVRRGNPQHMLSGMPHPGPLPPSLEILNQRLAKGEISVDEYKRLRETMFFQQ